MSRKNQNASAASAIDACQKALQANEESGAVEVRKRLAALSKADKDSVVIHKIDKTLSDLVSIKTNDNDKLHNIEADVIELERIGLTRAQITDIVDIAYIIRLREKKINYLNKDNTETLTRSLKQLFDSESLWLRDADLHIRRIVKDYFEEAARIKKGLPRNLPEKGEIPLYREAKKRGLVKNPLEMYRKYWEPYVEAGLLYQDWLRRYDFNLIKAIRNHCRTRPELNFADYLPPPRGSEISKLIDATGLTAEEIVRLGRRIAKRSERDTLPQ